MVEASDLHVQFVSIFSELSEVKDHDRRVTQEAQQAQEDVSLL